MFPAHFRQPKNSLPSPISRSMRHALKAGILAGSGETEEALKELTGAAEKAQPKDLPKAAIALSQLLAHMGKPDEVRATLEKAHEKDPKNLQLVDTLANTAFVMQDWKGLEKYESWLKTIEGSEGTEWRSYRTQRLLATAQAIDDKDFQEAVAHVNDILKKRPHWSKGHYLQGEVAYRMGRTDSAIAAYERAWQYGGRGILLADRLIDLLSKQGRYTDARKYVAQVRDYLTVSQGLFDRAIPYMAEGNESQEMERMAEQWVKQNPNDAEAHLRLGRIFLLRFNTPKAEQKQRTKIFDQANSEFRRAIELAPNDVGIRATIVTLLADSPKSANEGESPDPPKEAERYLEEFVKQEKIGKLERSFVAAQLYDMLNASSDPRLKKRDLLSQAQIYFNEAATLPKLTQRPPVPIKC